MTRQKGGLMRIPPGTKWEDVPVDWVCPDCGVGKEDFDMVPFEGAGKSY